MKEAMTVRIVRSHADLEAAARLRCTLTEQTAFASLALHFEEYDLDTFGKPNPQTLEPLHDSALTILMVPSTDHGQSLAAIIDLRRKTHPDRILLAVPEGMSSQVPTLLQSGATDFILSPCRASDLLPRVCHLLRRPDDTSSLISKLKGLAGVRQIIGSSPALMAQVEKLPRFAGCDATVLIVGETGTGKELFARAVHHCSRRSGQPLVVVDCAAIPAELMENELFGHEKGAYTTAHSAKAGLFQEAEGGSLFLDEIDSLSAPMQSKLLRFLQEKEFRPLGSTKPRQADVRVIAATNQSLDTAVAAGRFRRDLYYRINVLALHIPNLRDRPSDIPLLARHFAEKYAAEFLRPAREFTADAIETLVQHNWPGNARELENMVQRAVLGCESNLIDASDLDLPMIERQTAEDCYQARKDRMVAQWEFEELKRMLTRNQGNVVEAARKEGKDPGAIRALLRKHHLRPASQAPHWQSVLKTSGSDSTR